MKLLFAFAIVAIVSTAAFGASDPWEEYKTKHGKKYNPTTEDAQRKKLFLATDAIIAKHNSQENVTFQLGHNQFSDMTPAEWNNYHGAVRPANQTRSLESLVTVDMKDRALPTSFDYRNSTCLAPVKNQGQCGSCWAFAAIAPLEYVQCKTHGTPVILSEQQLVDCDPYDSGCNGGWYTNAWYYLQNVAGGSALNSSYPYTATTNTCKFTSSMTAAKVSSYGNLQALNVTNMQSALQVYGPIAVAIEVITSFQLYSGGVYTDTACNNLGVNHAVVVVGWGTINGIDYWVVRNSWGTKWGLSGYILMQRGVNLCNIEQYPSLIVSVF